jgi:5-methylcytosine-specific restriction endonuclease McrA
MASGWISKGQRKEIYHRDNLECCYCGKKCIIASGMSKEEQKQFQLDSHDRLATLDHVISRWEIAQSCESDAEFRREIKNPKNLVTVCGACNSSKKHTPLYIWVSKKRLDYGTIVARIAERIG